ncbi:glycosyl hydrolase family 28 protein [Mucilaginibacter sp. CSA2-8R]|uniref:glycoside hydrolase family 28 protein n=1 Tax=Mucilaginibacter sp. CSA2-8R TaxID=3141542 RepID=UPI00315D01DC
MKFIKYLLIAFFCLSSPQLFAKDYLATMFGIHSDGLGLNTRSIQFAIDYINKNGGGRLVFHVGRYLTGSIYLKSNVTIQLEEGAVLMGSLNPFDYDQHELTALIFAIDQENIGITGRGMIDGQGKAVARNVIEIINKGLIKDKFRSGRPEVETRAMNISFLRCNNVLIKGIMLKNSASWNQTYDQCKNMKMDSVYVDNKDYWNEDGVDIIDCEDVSITNSFFDAADDCICLKSHNAKHVCKNILISNNTVRSSANGIKFGTVSRGGFSDIRIINNKVYDTYRSALALEAVDGGYIENIVVDSLQSYNTGNAIFLRTGERFAKGSRFNNVTISNVYAEIPAGKPDAGYEYEGPIEDMPRNVSPGIIISGVPNCIIKNVKLNNIEVKHPGGGNAFFANVPLNKLNTIPEISNKYPDFSMFKELPAWGMFVKHATGLEFNNIKISNDKKDFRVPVVLDDVHDAKFNGLKVNQTVAKKQDVFQNNSTQVSIK